MPYSGVGYSGRFGTKVQSVRPLWTAQFEDEDSFLEWAKDMFDVTRDEHKQMIERDLQNRDFYLGLQSAALGKEGIPRDREGKRVEKFSRVVINHIYELTEQWVSKMTRYPPAIAVIPPNQEYNDRIAAQMSKDFIDYLFYVNDADDIIEEVARNCRIDGEAYAVIRWDDSIGDLSPQQAQIDQMNELGIRIPLLDESGQPVMGEDGEQLFIEKKQRVGDVRYQVIERRFVILDPKTKYVDCNWAILVSAVDVDELRAKYPQVADRIDVKTPKTTIAGDLFESDQERNEILVFELIHKGSEFLDSGRYIKFLEGVVLENCTLKEKFGHDEFPWARVTNIDCPGILRGISFLENLKLLNVMYNNMASINYTNMSLASHVYWMVPREGRVDVKKIRNGASILQYTGGVPPRLERFQCIGEDSFKFSEFLDQSMLRMSGIQGVSRGEPPQGIEAGVALAFLEEQENQRANTDIKKHNAFVKKLARLSLATAGAFYKPEDGRTIRIVGKNNSFSVQALNVAKLGGPYDIRVQRTTALSESKAGRLSQILALESRFPGMLPREQIMDMLDLANDKKFYNLASVAVEAQERESELMMQGQPVADAAEFEEHLVHWFSLKKHMQSASFKEDTPPEIKALFIKHGASHELFMHIKMQTSQMYAQLIATQAPEFPTFTLPGTIQAPMAGSPTGVATPSGEPPASSGQGPSPDSIPEESAENASPGAEAQPAPPTPPSEQPSPPTQ